MGATTHEKAPFSLMDCSVYTHRPFILVEIVKEGKMEDLKMSQSNRDHDLIHAIITCVGMRSSRLAFVKIKSPYNHCKILQHEKPTKK